MSTHRGSKRRFTRRGHLALWWCVAGVLRGCGFPAHAAGEGTIGGDCGAAVRAQPRQGFPLEQVANGLKPLVDGLQEFNTSALASSVAVAAGVSAIKRAMSNHDFNIFDPPGMLKSGASKSFFPAVLQDGSRVPTSVPSGAVQDIQWLPPEWQTWGRKVKEEGLRHLVPDSVKKTREDLTLQYQLIGDKVKDELSRLPTWDALNQELVEKFNKGGLPLYGLGQSAAARFRKSVKSFQDTLTSKLAAVRGKLITPRSRKAGLAASSAEVAATNQMLLGRLFTVLAGDGWEHVLHQDGVDVYRKRVVDLYQGGEKFYCIKAVGTIKARPESVYDLLKDSSRVGEYNDECVNVQDLEALSEDTKVTWASSKAYFPFKARDFVTRCHNTQLQDGTFVVLTRSEDIEFEGAKNYGKDFVRTEVLLAGNVMRPVPGNPNLTEFTTIAHINPGGAADTPLGAQLANKICTYGPVSFIRKLESICAG